MQPKRTPTKSRSALLLAVALAFAAGCGGHERRRAEPPKLRAHDSAPLIALAQKIAGEAATDGCAAQRDIAALDAQAKALAASGRVPLRLRAPLLAGVAAVAADAPACTPPPAPAPPKPHGKPKEHGHHHKGHGEKG